MGKVGKQRGGQVEQPAVGEQRFRETTKGAMAKEEWYRITMKHIATL